MKIYLAMRYQKIDVYRTRVKELEHLGHIITTDWSRQDNTKPYEKNIDKIQGYLRDDIQGIKEADIFILCSEKHADARAMYIELGLALGFEDKVIYVVNEDDDSSIFYFHQKVKLLKNWNELIKMISSK